MLTEIPFLSLAIWFPIIGGLIVLATGDDGNAPRTRIVSLIVSVVTFLLTIPLYTLFDITTPAMQFVERSASPWIEAFNIYYHVGIDGFAMPLILLTSFSTVLIVIAGWEVIQKRVAQYMAAFLIMEGFVIGVFSALDAMLFYVFWEGMLIPMFLIIGIWGGP
ncbi:MAG: NADH-quinone oxidoreductase subunit M, partial [Gammaproteobacteria bacterium]|nr:NADH-quinone oxidoreductase subunit M [Gammaproteobacteria bacterium]